MSERQGDTRQRKPTQEEQLLAYFRKPGLAWRSARQIVEGTNILCYTRRITTLRRARHRIEMRWHVNAEGRKDYTEYRLAPPSGDE